MGREGVLCILAHTQVWERRNVFIALEGRHHFILIFGYGRMGNGLSGVRGESCVVCLSLKTVLSSQGASHSSGGPVSICLYACSIFFSSLCVLPCGILGFSLSRGAAGYCKEAA